MDFGDRIKKLRAEKGLTQEQFSQKLNISRQAVSNWENNRNLPDIEMLFSIAEIFSVSLDELILGETPQNNMTKKLIKDGSETRRARYNMISVCVGVALFLLGGLLLVIKALSVEYIDSAGVLHENFFLIPTAFLLLFASMMVFSITGIRRVIGIFVKKRKKDKNQEQ